MGKTEFHQSSTARYTPAYNENPPRPRKNGGRVIATLRKWWWALLIVLICVILVVVLPIILVDVPRKAQKDVNNSRLQVRSIMLTDPTPSSAEQVLLSDSSFDPYLDAFNAPLFLEETPPNVKPFAYVMVLAVHSTGAAPSTIDQIMQIVNPDQFTKYTTMVLNSEEYRLAIQGRVGLKQRGLRKMTVDYNEVVTLKVKFNLCYHHFVHRHLTERVSGLNKLKGFNVTEFHVLTKPDPDGANMVGKVSVPNPSIMTIAMVNVTMNLRVGTDLIGTALLPNLTLSPGNNMVEMRSTTDQAAILRKLAALPDGLLPFDITGNSSVYNGQHLTYYEEALKSNTVSVKLNLARALGIQV